jgi:hypothetical protein
MDEQRIQPGRSRDPLGLHPSDVFGHSGELHLRAKHIRLPALADTIHGLYRRDEILEDPEGLVRHLERAVHLIQLVESHGCLGTGVPGGVPRAGPFRFRSFRRYPRSQTELAGEGNHLHELQLVHPQWIGEPEPGEASVHQPELELRIGRAPSRCDAGFGRPGECSRSGDPRVGGIEGAIDLTQPESGRADGGGLRRERDRQQHPGAQRERCGDETARQGTKQHRTIRNGTLHRPPNGRWGAVSTTVCWIQGRPRARPTSRG